VSEDDLTVELEVSDTVDDLSGVPVLPLRDVVVYPHMVIPLFVGREKSIVALDRAMNAGKKILLIAQQKADLDDPQPEDLYDIGTLATILQLLKLPDGTVKVLVEGGEANAPPWTASRSGIISRPKLRSSRKRVSTMNARSMCWCVRSLRSSSNT
jgi:ATP-dependent Lon protease